MELQRDKQERDARERDLRERELREMEIREKMKQELEMKPPGKSKSHLYGVRTGEVQVFGKWYVKYLQFFFFFFFFLLDKYLQGT